MFKSRSGLLYFVILLKNKEYKFLIDTNFIWVYISNCIKECIKVSLNYNSLLQT